LKAIVSKCKPERDFWNALGDLSCKKGFVVYPVPTHIDKSKCTDNAAKEIARIFS